MTLSCVHSLTPPHSTPVAFPRAGYVNNYTPLHSREINVVNGKIEMYDCPLYLSLAHWLPLTHKGFCDEATLNPDPPVGIKLICSCSPARPRRVYSHAKNWEQEEEESASVKYL